MPINIKEVAESLKIATEELVQRFPALADKDDPNWDDLYSKNDDEPFWQQ